MDTKILRIIESITKSSKVTNLVDTAEVEIFVDQNNTRKVLVSANEPFNVDINSLWLFYKVGDVNHKKLYQLKSVLDSTISNVANVVPDFIQSWILVETMEDLLVPTSIAPPRPEYVKIFNIGTVSVDTTIDLNNGRYQKLQGGLDNVTVNIVGFKPTGILDEVTLEIENGGLTFFTWTNNINWIAFTGGLSTEFSDSFDGNSGKTGLQATGIDFIKLWTTNGGTTVFGKVL